MLRFPPMKNGLELEETLSSYGTSPTALVIVTSLCYLL